MNAKAACAGDAMGEFVVLVAAGIGLGAISIGNDLPLSLGYPRVQAHSDASVAEDG
ncbi:MAG: hypothetical protein JRM83_07405 [Nitrososphaerota archaeon]|nr:hypothetical protein [Nitrososphaerota archaeon]